MTLLSGYLIGDNISESKRTLGDLKNVFQNEAARAQMNPAAIVYEVQSHMAVKDGTPGGLFFGTSNVMPGQVGGEYFMTKGTLSRAAGMRRILLVHSGHGRAHPHG